MKTINLFFPKQYTYRKFSLNKLVGWCIKRTTKGKYFHVGVFAKGFRIGDQDALVYEAQAPAKKVVIEKISRYNHDTLADVYEIEVTDEQHKKVFDYLKKMVGRRYDFRGVLSFIFGFVKQRNSRFYCSELVRNAFQYAGIELHKKEQVSPSDIANCSKLQLIKENLKI